MQGVEWRVEGGMWPSHAEQSEAARGLLCRLLGEPVAVEHTATGAPYLPQYPELAISISHCRAAVAVAVSSRGAVGIDVESRRRVAPSLVERVCTPAERQAIAEAEDADMEFLQIWTRKEAILKCRGTGIRGFGSVLQAAEAADCTVSDMECPLPDVVGALAVELGKN